MKNRTKQQNYIVTLIEDGNFVRDYVVIAHDMQSAIMSVANVIPTGKEYTCLCVAV